jgi:hypothetical protein
MIDIKMLGDTLRTYPVNERKALDELCERYTQFHGNTRQSIEEVRFGAEPLNMKVDRLMFLLRKLYGSGIIMQDLLAQVVLLIRQYQYELAKDKPANQDQQSDQVQQTSQDQQPASQLEQPIQPVPPHGQPIETQLIETIATNEPLQQQGLQTPDGPVIDTRTAMENLLAAAALNAIKQEPVAGSVLDKATDTNNPLEQSTMAHSLNSTQPAPANQGTNNVASVEKSNASPKATVTFNIDPTPLISFVNGTTESKITESEVTENKIAQS